jgi:molybdopterin-guanine dinucleotide biosynthesis protein B
MIPIISIIGSVKSGKTFFIEALVGELKRRKYKVGAIKHSAHSFEVDKPGKDSFRLKECGSDIGGIFSNDSIALVEDLSGSEDIFKLIFDNFYSMDIVFVEGYKKGKFPKILVLTSGDVKKETGAFGKDEIIAVVGESRVETDLNYFGRYEIKKVADFLVENFIKVYAAKEVELFVNEKSVVLNYQMQKVFKNIITGAVKSLKGLDGDIESIDLRYKKSK